MLKQQHKLYLAFFILQFSLCIFERSANASTYTDPHERFILEFPQGWSQGQTSEPSQQAYFSYTENKVVLAEVIIYSQRLPHAMNAAQLQATIAESMLKAAKFGDIIPDPSTITLKNFGIAEASIAEYDYAGAHQTAMRMRNYYFIHPYTGTGIIIRFGSFKQYWPQIAPKFDEVMKGLKMDISNITIESLKQQNLMSVTEPPIFQHPESFQGAYPWTTPAPSSPYDEGVLANTRLLKGFVQNNPSLQYLTPKLEKTQKEYETRVQQAQTKKDAQNLGDRIGHVTSADQNASTIPEGALGNILGSPKPMPSTGDIFGKLQTPEPIRQNENITLGDIEFLLWEDPWKRYRIVYPKNYKKTQKGQWYLAFEGPAGIQFLVLCLMDHQAAVDFFKDTLKDQEPIEAGEQFVSSGDLKMKALVTVFRTKNEELEFFNDMITTSVLPEEGSFLFFVTFPQDRYIENQEIVKKLVQHFIQNIKLKG